MKSTNKDSYMTETIPAYAMATEVHAVPLPPPQQQYSSGGSPAPPSAPFPNTSNSTQGTTAPQARTAEAKDFLAGQGWPSGLQDTFMQNLNKIPMRFFICDDSGSMMANDGHKLVGNASGQKMIGCTRWNELADGLRFHAGIARAAAAPTEFRLLNGSAPIMIGTGDDDEENRYEALMGLLSDSPGGGTPLCRHVREVIAQIRPMEAQLRANGQKVCVMIASDGESSDGNVAEALRPLKALPVWVVVRLCTDEDRIVDYWNNIDSELELEMDVLDDLSGEAQEIYAVNPWLTYGAPLHRLREFGIPIKEMDLIDETKLSLEQARKVCAIILGGRPDDYPHPEVDLPAFLAEIERRNNRTSKVWNPMAKRMTEWINAAKLRKLRKSQGCVVS